MKGAVFYIFGLFLHVPVLPVVAYASETSLRSTLKSAAYDKFARPNMPTTVYFRYAIRSLQSLDITAQTMKHAGWFTLIWNDPRLMWTPSSYANISKIEVNWTWRPEFILSNSLDSGMGNKGFVDDDTRMTVFSDGTVRWAVDVTMTTSCDVHPAKFPFDEQECVVEAAFWGHDYDTALKLNLSQTEAYTELFQKNGEWVLTSSRLVINTVPNCCPLGSVAYISTYIAFARLRPFYVINLLLPSILLSLCMTWAFIIPTECGERLGYTLTILLSYTVLLTITSAMLPTTSQETPYIASYLLVILVFCTMAVFNVAVNVKYYFLEDKPSWRVRLFCIKLHPFVFFERSKLTKGDNRKTGNAAFGKSKVQDVFVDDMETENSSIPHQIKQPKEDTVSVTTQDSSEHVTYRDLSILLDRICFYVYLVGVVCVTIWLLVSLTAS